MCSKNRRKADEPTAVHRRHARLPDRIFFEADGCAALETGKGGFENFLATNQKFSLVNEAMIRYNK